MADLEQFLIERLNEFDPTIATGPGTLARRIIIDPTVTRFGTDPFAVDIRTLIVDRIRQEFPSLDVNKTAVDDLLVKPLSVILEPLRREIQAISIQQSLEDPSLLLEEEADALVANLLVSRIQGSRARGVERLYFNAAINFVALPSQSLLTTDGVVFHPTSLQAITATQMQSNNEDGFFFFDITVEAEEEGEAGLIEPGELNQITDAPGVARVTNKARFTGGLDRQTNTELKEFAEESVTERSLTTSRGVISQILDGFSVEDVIAIGYGDVEMDRDIIESVGRILDSATLAATASITGVTLTDTAQSFTTADVRVGDKVTFFSGPNQGTTHDVTVVTATTLALAGSPSVDAGPISYIVSQRNEPTLTISSIPGGILSDPPIIEDNNVVHIGNHTDAYVKAPVLDQDSLDILNLPDPADDKDLLDSSHIDVDLISYVKAQTFGAVTSGTDELVVATNLRKFGLVKNDIIRFLSPSTLTVLGDLRVESIEDDAPMILHLEDLNDVAFSDPSLSHPTINNATFQVLSTHQGIEALQMPFVRVTKVELMNSASPPQPISGATIPYKDPVDIRSTDFFSSGAVPATGKFRLYFLEPTMLEADAGTGAIFGTLFKVESDGATLYYRPDPAAILGDLGTGVRKVRDPALAAATPMATGVGNGQFTAAGTFSLTSGTFTVAIDPGDMFVVKNAAGLILGNFYATASALSTATSVAVTPDFTGAIPTLGLTWAVLDKDDLTAQRISAKDMSKNKEGSLFYVDIAAKSFDLNTTGDAAVFPGTSVDDRFNITQGLLATVAGHRTFGYFFKQNTNPSATRDETLAFSIHERLIMSFTDRFMQQSVSDPANNNGRAVASDPSVLLGATNNNATGLEARNIRVSFEKAPVIQSIQSFVDSGSGRVITENILIKHMIPAFVDLVVNYIGGLTESQAQPLLEELIDETDSDENLSASDIDFLFRERVEASDVTMPLGLISIVHGQNRTITVERSENALFVGRISHFFPGKLELTRQ